MEPQQKKFKYTKEEAKRLVSLLEKNDQITRNYDVDSDDFVVELESEGYKEKFKTQEKVFSLKVGRKQNVSLVTFVQSLFRVFQYFINAAHSMVSSKDDYVRFIFSKAPVRYFSTATLKLKEFTPQLFLNVLEKNMQSNREVTAKGWSTSVVISAFPYGRTNKKRRKTYVSRKKCYNDLGKGNTDGGGAQIGKNPSKHGGCVKHGVLQILLGKFKHIVKDCCFVLAILVGVSYLNNDEKVLKLKKMQVIL